MSVLIKIFTAIRGGTRKLGESIVDANSITIIEQEIKDAENHLAQAKSDLASVMAQELQTSRNIDALQKDISVHEGYASSAIDKGNEELAMEIAQKIAEMQEELCSKENMKLSFSSHSSRLKEMIKNTSRALSDMQRQLVIIKTTDSVQKATTAITDNYAAGSSKLLTAKETLGRIKKRQDELEDRLTAGVQLQDELEGKGLEQRMKDAGIIEDKNKAHLILEQLKNKKQGQ